MYTIGSLFSGVGGLDLAAHWAGFATSWFVEREPFCQKVLAKHWAGVPIHSDVFECHDLPHVDVIVGGFPCQPFSVAGSRKGADDERYLLPEMLRIIREVKPYAVLFENVRGFPQIDDGYHFKYLLRELAAMGLYAEWGHIRASDVGAPQDRERWICIAYVVDAPRFVSSDFREGHAGKQQQAIIAATSKRHVSKPLRQTGTNRQLRSRRIPERVGEPGLFRVADGLPSRMDFPGWPARPGEDQHAYEPSRTIQSPTIDYKDRLKAIGNAVVPQVVYPLFVAIHEWLAEIETGTQRTDTVA